MTEFMSEYHRWLKSADSETKKELEGIKDNEQEIKYRFSSNLSFGTAGLRGIMMAGRNAMNVYTVAQATQGLADLINAEGGAERGVCIGYDSRNNSELFAKISAGVLAENGIKVYIYDELRPTPMISFGLRYLGCIAGINITASHNPKEYNGYKVYWEDGAQISPEQAKTVSASIQRTDVFSVSIMDFDRGVEQGKIEVLSRDVDEAYLENVMAQAVDKNIVPKMADSMGMVYTPFNGAGYRLIPEVFKRAGFKHIYPVTEQAYPDGNFPTLKSPNPENAEGFELGIKVAEETGCDLVVASDPDADRVGVMAKNKDGKFVTISGNRMGALLLDYILTAYTENGNMPADPYAVKTIVSTNLAKAICDAFGVKLYDVLTGFKYIGEVIKNSEKTGVGFFILGFEESYGYLKGTYARDKDAVVASMLIAEMAAYYKSKNMTLCDALDKLFEKYGYFCEKTINIEMKGFDGPARMKALMEGIRANTPESFAGRKVVTVKDYLAGTVTDIATGISTPTGLPESDVMYFVTEDGTSVIFRPSGTEPKVKLYLLLSDKDSASAEAKLAEFEAAARELCK